MHGEREPSRRRTVAVDARPVVTALPNGVAMPTGRTGCTGTLSETVFDSVQPCLSCTYVRRIPVG